MKIFVSVDMESIAAVATPDQVRRGGSGYQRAQELMTAEANAAIAGAICRQRKGGPARPGELLRIQGVRFRES